MQRRYRKAANQAGQIAIAAVIIAGLLGSAALVVGFMMATYMVTS